MNYCTKCHSLYTKPGTCNCYAGGPPVPWVPQQPVFPYPPWRGTGDPPIEPPFTITSDPPYTTWGGSDTVSDTVSQTVATNPGTVHITAEQLRLGHEDGSISFTAS